MITETSISLNGQIRYTLEVRMTDFMNLKVNKCHKIGRKIVSHKDIFPNNHKSHKIKKYKKILNDRRHELKN
jgi:hypothetical protein